MSAKMYKLRSVTVERGQEAFKDLDLEFEGKRAFVIWDSVVLGNFQLKARLEINPHLLQKVARPNCDYLYCGCLVLPRPEHN
jgi:hypothetical protein